MSINAKRRPQQAAAVGSAKHNRIVTSRSIDGFNARDDVAEAATRTVGEPSGGWVCAAGCAERDQPWTPGRR